MSSDIIERRQTHARSARTLRIGTLLRWMLALAVLVAGLILMSSSAQAQILDPGGGGDCNSNPQTVTCDCGGGVGGYCLCEDTDFGSNCWCNCPCNTYSCNLKDGWYNDGASYQACNNGATCTYQDKEYRNYSCTLTDGCDYTVTNTKSVKKNCTTCLQQACGSWNYDSYSSTCDETRSRHRTCYNSGCSGGSCYNSGYTVWGTVSRDTDGKSCGSTSCGSWSSCDYSNTCDESGTQTRTCTNPTCGNGSCQSDTYTQSRSCSRDTDGKSCGSTQRSSWSSCSSFSNTCDETGTQTRTVTEYDCSSGSCSSSTSTESRSCSRNTDGKNCGSDGWYDSGSSYSCCKSGQSCTCQDQKYRNYSCGSGSCSYSVTNTRTVKSGCSSCSDGNSCTVDSCSGGSCQHTRIDEDNDGYTTCEGDCNDSNASINPGESETCNGRDDDCDGQTDEGCNCINGQERSCGQDTGVCRSGTQTCVRGNWGSCEGNVGPSNETCNGVDDDCDGQTDEGCNCINGEERSCGEDTGVCQRGTQTCENGDWGSCEGNVGPSSETCNGVDDDCDGQTDEGCNCINGQERSCGQDTGVCERGTQTCVNGDWASCQGNVGPSTETCNGLDDDCDGQVDENFSNLGDSCSEGTGACQDSGTYVCNSSGDGTTCTASAGSPSTETCNGIDDDCDGAVDENLTKTCGSDVGACSTGIRTCSSGSYGSCQGNTGPSSEACDGVDNDCDGQADEDFSNLGNSCSEGTGACQDSGTYVCNSSGSGTTCTATPGSPSSETCNGIDDDCDGSVDEGDPGGGSGCSTGEDGVCSAGTTACSGGQIVCERNTAPETEVCDGKDNDCDGAVDDGVKTTFYADADGDGYGDPDVSTRACSAPTNYVTNDDDCDDEAASVHPDADEMCNDIDDDCDGDVDEDFTRLGQACSEGTGACRDAGVYECTTDGSGTTCSAEAGLPSAEVCNGIDDDCNGRVDDGDPGGGAGCSTGKAGVCEAGTTACVGGSIECHQNVAASSEMCNYLDDDCDGQIDEDFPDLGQPCAEGTGACHDAGSYVCNSSGTASTCNANPGQPTAEVCNGIDDDCDGTADDGEPGADRDCDTGKEGVCAAGTTICSEGSIECIDTTEPSAEICGDGLDNNCDGVIDEGCQDNGWEFDTCNKTTATEVGEFTPQVMFMVDQSNSMVDEDQRVEGCSNWERRRGNWHCDVNNRLGWWKHRGYYSPYRYPGWPEDSYYCSNSHSCYASFSGKAMEEPSYGWKERGDYERWFWYGAQGTKWDTARDKIVQVASSYQNPDGTNRLKFGFGTFNGELAHEVPADEDSWGEVHLEAFNYQDASQIEAYYEHPQQGGVGWGTPTASGIRAMAQSSTVSNPNRPTAGVLITDGQPHTRDGERQARLEAIDAACDHADVAHMYVVGFGSESDEGFNNLLAAAGGTGTCTDAGGQSMDVCKYDPADLLDSSFDCEGSYQADDGDEFEAVLDEVTNNFSCTYPIDILGSPDGAAPSDPSGTRVFLDECNDAAVSQTIQGGDFVDNLSSQGTRSQSAPPNLTCAGGCGGTNWNGGYVTYPVETTPGVTHTLRVRIADYLHDCRDSMKMGIYLDGTSQRIDTWYSSGSAEWTIAEFSFTPTKTTSHITLRQENDACCSCSDSCTGSCPDTEALNDMNLRIDQLEVIDPSGGCSPDGRLGYVPPGNDGDGWRYGPDRKSVELVGAACEAVQDRRHDQIITQMACPCENISGSACDAADQEVACATGTWQCTDTWNDTCVAGTTCEWGCGPRTNHSTKPVQPNVQLVVDRSGSMGTNYVDGRNLWHWAEVVTEGLAEWSFRAVGCTIGAEPQDCDKLRLGLHFWSSVEIPKLSAGEDTTPSDIDDIFDDESPPSGGTEFHQAADLLEKEDALRDAENPNVGIFITDGNTSSDSLHQAADTLCDIRNRAAAPVATYAVGFGGNTDYQSNALVAAAGGTGSCCDARDGNCDPYDADDAIDPCEIDRWSWGGVDYDDLYCEGAITALDADTLTDELMEIFTELECSYPLTLPEGMDSASENPEGTTVEFYISAVNALVDIPYVGDAGQALVDEFDARGIPNAEAYADDGWSFGNQGRTLITLSDDLCELVRDRTVDEVYSQVCKACEKTGESCQVPCTEDDEYCDEDGYRLGRCREGVYSCIEAEDVCTPVRSAMPEICNGLDDDCDGAVDDLADNKEDWGGTDYDLRTRDGGEYAQYSCYDRNVCRCPEGPDTFGGTAESEDELQSMIDHQAQTGECFCGAGLSTGASE